MSASGTLYLSTGQPFPRRTLTFPQQFTNDEGGSVNKLNPSTSYSRDRNSNQFSRYEQHQDLFDRIDPLRPEHPKSLRERVHVPAKRDQDEAGGSFGNRYENSLEDDGGDLKKVKKHPKMTKPNLNRRDGWRKILLSLARITSSAHSKGPEQSMATGTDSNWIIAELQEAETIACNEVAARILRALNSYIFNSSMPMSLKCQAKKHKIKYKP
ncbi:hypothetical protein BDQ17DRAFT_1339524 [Cyathus striatus]|nr:hypothetical protein BDQ17DRAFT_1339524 [Cyathus striatus]